MTALAATAFLRIPACLLFGFALPAWAIDPDGLPAQSLRGEPREASVAPTATADAGLRPVPDPRPAEAAQAFPAMPGDTLASVAAAIYPKVRDRALRDAYVRALRQANPALAGLAPDEPFPPGSSIVLPDLRPLLVGRMPKPRPPAGASPAPGGHRFVLRLAAPELDVSRSRGIDERMRAQLRDRLLVLDADDPVAALLSVRSSVRQLEGRVAQLQLKLSALPAAPSPASSPAVPAPQPATAAVPAPPPAAVQATGTPPGSNSAPSWLWGLVALLFVAIAILAWRLRVRKAPVPGSELDEAGILMRGGARDVPDTDPAKLRRRYIEGRFPEIAGGTIAPDDPDSVVKAARLFYEDGTPPRAVELLEFAIEENPAAVKPWLALFEIYRLEGLAQEFAALAGRFREHHQPGDIWRKVQFIGRDIDPRNPLYRDAPFDNLETIGYPATKGRGPVSFDPLAENWLDAPMDFATDAFASSLRAGILADAGVNDADLVANPMPALRNIEIFTAA